MQVKIEKSWGDALHDEFGKPYFAELVRFLHKEKAEGNDGADKSGDGKESGNKDTTDEAGDGLIFYYRIIP